MIPLILKKKLAQIKKNNHRRKYMNAKELALSLKDRVALLLIYRAFDIDTDVKISVMIGMTIEIGLLSLKLNQFLYPRDRSKPYTSVQTNWPLEIITYEQHTLRNILAHELKAHYTMSKEKMLLNLAVLPELFFHIR